MARPAMPASRVPTPGPWIVLGEAELGTDAETAMLGSEPATDDRPGGRPYLIRQDRPLVPGSSRPHLASGIQRFADARLMAASPELAQALLRLLTSQELNRLNVTVPTRQVRDAAWDLLVRVAPHLEIGAGP